MRFFLTSFSLAMLNLLAAQDTSAFRIGTVTAEKMNIVYRRIENPITLAIPGVSCENTFARFSTGKIASQKSGCSYVVVPDDTSSFRVELFEIKNNDTLYCCYNLFRCLKVPDPLAFVSNCHDSCSISKTELVSLRGVFAKMWNFDFDLTCNVISFEMETVSNGKTLHFSTSGPAVTPEITKAFAQAIKGQTFRFYHINAVLQDKSIRRLNEVKLTVK